jgi:oxygen tolerance protein BatD
VRRALLAAVVAALSAGAVFAQDVRLRAEVDARRIGLQDQVQLTLTIEGSGINEAGEIALPPMTNLRVVGGPFSSQQVSIVNGSASYSKVESYVLRPLAVGRAEIGSARVRVGGGEKSSAPLTLDVVAGSVVPRRRPVDPFGRDPFGRDPFGQDPFESLLGRRRRAEPKLFVEANPNRTRLHVGEPLVITYYLYAQNVGVTDLRFIDAPQYPGFWSEDLDKPKAPVGEPATVEGETYRRFPVLQKLLFPTRAGTLTVPAARMRIGLQRGFFDMGELGAERATRPVVVTVDPIPEEPGFSGAVGRFRASASSDKASVAFGEAATVRFRVEGAGNIKWVDRGPELVVPGAKVYPPQVKSDLTPGPAGMSGAKTWEYVVIPETAGTLQVPPLAFSYFDPAAGRIVRTETSPLPLRVDASAGGAPVAVTAAPVARSGGAPVLRSDLDLPSRALPELSGLTMAIGLALVALGHIGLWGAARLRGLSRESGSGSRPTRSVRSALKSLSRVGGDSVSKEAAAALIEETLHDVFGPIDDTGPVPGGEKERAAREVLQEVRFLRYAPQLGDYSEKIREVADHASDVVRRWG